ncbi:MAG: methyltransferase regulatory domain-containing protein [Steroidobacteraceae bacterium]|nr:methyltransferase regulatory domain-containing protein [Steroidobacteraceae bacterium]MCC7200689.1 methyltransferase regulatory domain-containing protein [Gammaproteobacteria bacterium]
MNWSDGYVSDAEYTSHYYAELAPPHLDFAALAAGVMPPDRSGGRFRYCELGCGNGMSTTILAASNPDAEFVGIDFMPVHIANSRKAARRGGLTNVQFRELSFADACREDLGQFDYIVAHGVYSWITPENRAEMVDFYRKFLAPGGLVYLSYNTYPGWLGISPVQKIVSEIARTRHGRSTERALAGFDFAARLLKSKAATLELYPGARQQIETARNWPANYLAQEYLNEAWYPLYVTEVMRELAPAKLEYVASATLAENDLRLVVSDELAATIREQPTEELRQLVKDISMNARFRRDVYTRGGRRLSGLDQRQLLAERHVALTRAPEAITYRVEHLGRSLNFDTPHAHAVVEALAGGPAPLGRLAAACAGAPDPLSAALEAAQVLFISNQALPVDEPRLTPAQMNEALTSAALEDSACNAVASALGTGVPVTPLEMALLSVPGSLGSLETAAEALRDIANRKGRVFHRAGKRIEGEEALAAFLTEEVGATLRNRVPAFRKLGLLPPVLPEA